MTLRCLRKAKIGALKLVADAIGPALPLLITKPQEKRRPKLERPLEVRDVRLGVVQHFGMESAQAR